MFTEKRTATTLVGSTVLKSYVDYMGNWMYASEEDINSILAEHALFVNVGKFSAEAAIESVFNALENEAREVRDATVKADQIQIAADGAAIAAVWSFGLGFAAFVILEAGEWAQRKVVSSKQTKLNKMLKTADDDIAKQVSSDLEGYIKQYKSNNSMIKRQAVPGFNTRRCRAILLQFIAAVELSKIHKTGKKGSLTVEEFRDAAAIADEFRNCKEVEAVYHLLDELHLKGVNDVGHWKEFHERIKGLGMKEERTRIISTVITFGDAMAKLSVNVRREVAHTWGQYIYGEEAAETLSRYGASAVEKMIIGIDVLFSCYDAYMEVLDVNEVIEQCAAMIDFLENKSKASYVKHFAGICDASTRYNEEVQKTMDSRA